MSLNSQLTRRALLKTSVLGVLGLPVLTGCTQIFSPDDDASSESPVVEMTDDLRFEPSTLTIKAGQTVTWKNTGNMVHTATADPSQAQESANVALPTGAMTWDSDLVRAGEEWQHTFEIAGEYHYFCLPHEAAGMIGTIIVQD